MTTPVVLFHPEPLHIRLVGHKNPHLLERIEQVISKLPLGIKFGPNEVCPSLFTGSQSKI